MKSLSHARVVYALCAFVAGCAVPVASSVATAPAAPIRVKTITALDAKDAITIGTSTQADVIAALGKTAAITFDTGFEVWVYQYEGEAPARGSWAVGNAHAGTEPRTPGKTEFVILFAPTGVVTKTRIRSAPAPSAAKGT